MKLSYRAAENFDLEAVLKLIVSDQKGKGRDCADLPIDQTYVDALKGIQEDPNNHLFLCCLENQIVGCFQLTFIPGLSRYGAWRGQIETVRVSEEFRSQGIGGEMMRFAIKLCREKKCKLVQLTSDKDRSDAHSFYTRLGFQATHEGFKMLL